MRKIMWLAIYLLFSGFSHPILAHFTPYHLSQFAKQSMLHEIEQEKRILPHKTIVIVIDPGHGGKDPGAIGVYGTQEKNVVLSIARILQSKINRMPGYRAVLTRNTDIYLSLRQRLAIARSLHANLFIAIHADKFRNAYAQGVSIYALSLRGATSEAARWLAARENASELMSGVALQQEPPVLKSLLLNLSQSATIRESLEIGNNMLRSLQPIASLHHHRIEQAAFVVLKSPDIPSLLIETGFLSNIHEENRLNHVYYQTRLADAIMRGVKMSGLDRVMG